MISLWIRKGKTVLLANAWIRLFLNTAAAAEIRCCRISITLYIYTSSYPAPFIADIAWLV